MKKIKAIDYYCGKIAEGVYDHVDRGVRELASGFVEYVRDRLKEMVTDLKERFPNPFSQPEAHPSQLDSQLETVWHALDFLQSFLMAPRPPVPEELTAKIFCSFLGTEVPQLVKAFGYDASDNSGPPVPTAWRSTSEIVSDETAKGVREIAVAFRRAILSLDLMTLPVSLRKFPIGSCGDASLLLGTYLNRSNLGPFYYVSGDRHDPIRQGYSHAWLVRGDLLVDITADQFNGQPPIVVTKDQTWHLQFHPEISRSRVADLAEKQREFELAYQRIVQAMQLA